MSKIILMMLLLMSNSAMAGWSKVTVNEEVTIYAELSSLNKSNDKVKMWDLTDLKSKSTANKFQSIKTFHEYDCKLQKSRILAYTMYSGNMGNGNVLSSSNYAHDWLPVKSGGGVMILWNTACGKK
jgi:hypothetical protein